MLFSSSVLLSIIYSVSLVSASPAEHHQHHQHAKRDNTCSFPTDSGLVAVTEDQRNGGWAMSPDQQCTAGKYCPYACPSGQLMNQWDKSATTYSYPKSQNGGLYCNDDGTTSKPFDGEALCVDGEGTVEVDNTAGDTVAFCQTVLPGNEDMLIPTEIGSSSTETLAVPGPDYWASTAAHYYINAPGISKDKACTWATSSDNYGNWAPYVAGANMDDNGNTFVKLGWNPVYLEDSSAYKDQKPSFGVRIKCDGGDCNGTPCEIDPSKNDINEVSGSGSSGAGGGSFCVVTAANKATAKIEVFDVSGSSNSKRELKNTYNYTSFFDNHKRQVAEVDVETATSGSASTKANIGLALAALGGVTAAQLI